MAIFILIVFFCSLCQGRWDAFSHWDVSVDEATVGKNSIDLRCYCYMEKDLVNYREIVPVMFAQIRQNKSSTWRNIAMLNKTGYYMLNTDSIEGNSNYSISDGGCEIHPTVYYDCSMRIISLFTISGCSIDPDLYSVFRCQFSNGSGILTSQEKDTVKKSDFGFYALDFRQGSIKLQTDHENPFSEGDVVQLQFSGNIRSISALTKGVRWCKKESGKFKPISLQDSPVMTLVPSGQDGCTQLSLIFYHITQNDTELEITCDVESSIYDTECREYSDTPIILINTSIETKGNEWRLSPIIINDKDGIINSHNFTMQGSGRTIQLLCMASAFSATKLAVLNWCVRKNDQVIWNKIVLQEEEIKASGNNSFESVKFSRITYHITQYDRTVNFRCEISKSFLNACGSGHSFVNVTISKKEDKIPPTTENQKNLTAGTTVLSLTSTENQITSTVTALAAFSVLLCILLALVVLFVITTYRREETTLFGFIIKIKQKNKETEEIKRKEKKINNSLSKERGKKDNKKASNIGFESQGFYENEVLKNENAKEISTGKTEYESCKYEELQVKEKEQDYDELNLTKI